MIIQVGPPPCDGRYVTLIPRENSDHCEPVISDFLRGNWLWRNDVLGWIGPLPEPISADALRAAARALPAPAQEFDL